jgi:hypothetical protein
MILVHVTLRWSGIKQRRRTSVSFFPAMAKQKQTFG